MSLVERQCSDPDVHGPHWHESMGVKHFCDGIDQTDAYRDAIGEQRVVTEDECVAAQADWDRIVAADLDRETCLHASAAERYANPDGAL